MTAQQPSTLGARIRMIRERFCLKQDEFGEKIGISGNRISEIEHDKGGTGAAVLTGICREFPVHPEWILTGAGAMLKPGLTRRKKTEDVRERLIALEDKIRHLMHENPATEQRTVEVPLYSSAVVAGVPDLASCEVEDMITIPASWSHGKRELYAVRVQGESMTGAGIMPGDKLLVAAGSTARDSQIVIASVNGELTVKKLGIDRNGTVMLLPENRHYEPIVITPEMDFRILGIVLASMRNYS